MDNALVRLCLQQWRFYSMANRRLRDLRSIRLEWRWKCREQKVIYGISINSRICTAMSYLLICCSGAFFCFHFLSPYQTFLPKLHPPLQLFHQQVPMKSLKGHQQKHPSVRLGVFVSRSYFFSKKFLITSGNVTASKSIALIRC